MQLNATKLYELKHDIENRVEIDATNIDGINFYGNFHLYLLKFEKQKVLVYDYLKRIDVDIKLSELHTLFSKFDSVEYFESDAHKDLMQTDCHYASTYEKYVGRIGKHLWVHGPNRYNSYIFDAKYLLFGQYQHYAAEGLKFAYASFTHPIGDLTYARSITNKPAAWEMKMLFENKKTIEDNYFNDVLKQFNSVKPDFLHASGYSNYIEIYDTTSELMFKVTLNRDNFHNYEMTFPTKRKHKSRKLAIDLAFNFVIKHKSVSALLNMLMIDSYRSLTNSYLTSIAEFKKSKGFALYVNSMEAVINDMIERNASTFVSYPRMHGIFVRNNTIETNILNVSKGRNYLRIARNISYNSIDNAEPIQLKSFYIKGSPTEIAEQLFYIDCINIVDRKAHHDMTEYKLISENKLQKSKMLLREPVKTILNELFVNYENVQQSLEHEAENAVINNEIIEDTRKQYTSSKTVSLPEIRFMNKNIDKYVDTKKYKSNVFLFNDNRRIAKSIKIEYEATIQ